MHRIDSSTRELNKFGAGKDGFTEGEPGVTPATETTDDWFDGVQEEICNVIEGNGTTLVKGTRDQLYSVLREPVGENSTPAIAATVTSGDASAITGVGKGTGHGLQGTASGDDNASVGVRGVGNVSGVATASDGVWGVAAGNGHGVVGVGAGTDGHGVVGEGAGIGPGVKGTASGASNSSVGVEGFGNVSGAATSSNGVYGEGAGTSGHGIVGVGAGNGGGVNATGGSSNGTGIIATGGSGNGIGVDANATGNASGVDATGGPSSGVGLTATGGATNGAGIETTGAGFGVGIQATGGGNDGRGVYATGGATNGIGVDAYGAGSGTAVKGTADTTGKGVAGYGGSSSGYGGFFQSMVDIALVASGDTTSPSKAPFHITPQNALPTGPNAVGDMCVLSTDQKLYLCTVAGSPGTWTAQT